MPTKVAFLGPHGTYAEQAAGVLAKLERLEKAELVPCLGLRSVVEQAANGNCDAAVVPIENSIEGGVTTSLDALWSNPELCIRRALVLPIQHSLISSGQINQVSEVLSHPQALAQCSEWLSQNLPNAIQLPTSSTAEAARMIQGSQFRAAIASRSAMKIKGLNELAYPINDIAGNCTRFVLLQPGERKLKGDIASIAFSLDSNAPGALLKALSCIAELGLNMSRIESRPSKRELGEYVFFIDVELQNEFQDAGQKLSQSLKPLCEHLVNLGSYPSTEIDLNSIN